IRLLERNLHIKGRRADGIPLEVSTEAEQEFDLQNDNGGFPLESSHNFFIAFDLAHWFDNVDIAAPSVEVSQDDDGNPIIFVDDTHNTEILTKIRESIERSANLFEDSNLDHQLDLEETRHPLASGVPTR